MRKAAGIMLMILGALMLVGCIVLLIDYDINVHNPVFDILFMICGAFIVTGGVYCVKRKYWELCLASALVAIFIMISWLIGSYTYLTWLDWIYSILATLPIIFISLRKSEWSESQACLDFSTSQHIRG
jgi:hypothetical protein